MTAGTRLRGGRTNTARGGAYCSGPFRCGSAARTPLPHRLPSRPGGFSAEVLRPCAPKPDGGGVFCQVRAAKRIALRSRERRFETSRDTAGAPHKSIGIDAEPSCWNRSPSHSHRPGRRQTLRPGRDLTARMPLILSCSDTAPRAAASRSTCTPTARLGARPGYGRGDESPPAAGAYAQGWPTRRRSTVSATSRAFQSGSSVPANGFTERCCSPAPGID